MFRNLNVQHCIRISGNHFIHIQQHSMNQNIYITKHKTCSFNNSARLSRHFNLVIKKFFSFLAFSFGLIIQNVCNKLNENDFAVCRSSLFQSDWADFADEASNHSHSHILCWGLGIFFCINTAKWKINEKQIWQAKKATRFESKQWPCMDFTWWYENENGKNAKLFLSTGLLWHFWWIGRVSVWIDDGNCDAKTRQWTKPSMIYVMVIKRTWFHLILEADFVCT